MHMCTLKSLHDDEPSLVKVIHTNQFKFCFIGWSISFIGVDYAGIDHGTYTLIGIYYTGIAKNEGIHRR